MTRKLPPGIEKRPVSITEAGFPLPGFEVLHDGQSIGKYYWLNHHQCYVFLTDRGHRGEVRTASKAIATLLEVEGAR